ncbi:MAG: hypothetical protein JRC69_07750, partial [Deltaproteobacteria bacterium]|nr:hypothetical protein [Deltaproteobacteria bacterium]
MSQDNQTLKQRREKAESLEKLGVNLYSNSFTPTNAIEELLPKGDSLEAQETEPGGTSYSIAGRIMAMRKFGKAAFCHLTDQSDLTASFKNRHHHRVQDTCGGEEGNDQDNESVHPLGQAHIVSE